MLTVEHYIIKTVEPTLWSETDIGILSNEQQNQMKLLIFILSLFFFNLGFSQNDSLSKIEIGKKYVKRQCDSLFQIRKTLKDGKNIIYYDKDKKYIAYIFYLKQGGVTDLYREYTPYGDLTTGHFKNDSLWTFRFGNFKNDNFKVGDWYFLLGNQVTIPSEQYPYDYGSDSIYVETFMFKNDSISDTRKYHKRLGLIFKETFYYNGKTESEFIKYPNSTLAKDFDTLGNLTKIQLKEENDYKIDLNKSSIFHPLEATKCMSVSENFDSNNVNNGFIAGVYFDKNNEIISCQCKINEILFIQNKNESKPKEKGKIKKRWH